MLSKRKKQNVIKDTRIHYTDTGSSDVQLGLLTKQIEALSSHLKKNRKDLHSRRGLLGMVAKRHKQAAYLQKNDPKRYKQVATKLGLKVK